MGLTAIPFAVDVAKVRAVFGSKDRDLLEKIKTANLYSHYARQSKATLPAYQYNFDKALEDIIFRYVRPENRETKTAKSGLDENIAHGYGYALLVICDHLGTQCLQNCDGFYYGEDFETAADVIKKAGLNMDLGDMFEGHEVFDIPRIADFPAIKLFTKQEIDHINQVMDGVEIDESKADIDNEGFDEVQEMLMNIRDCFRLCKEKDVELITFTH